MLMRLARPVVCKKYHVNHLWSDEVPRAERCCGKSEYAKTLCEIFETHVLWVLQLILRCGIQSSQPIACKIRNSTRFHALLFGIAQIDTGILQKMLKRDALRNTNNIV